MSTLVVDLDSKFGNNENAISEASGIDVVAEVENALKPLFADGELLVHNLDRCPGGVHIGVEVTSAHFNGRPPVECHRDIYKALEGLMDKIHALKLKTNPTMEG